jgi:hypothetical protein
MSLVAVDRPAARGNPLDDRDLWPLPLTPFEKFLLLDDRPDYPMTFFGELRFSGELRREPFEHSLALAAARNPLLRARVDDDATPPRWTPADPYVPLDDWASTGTPIHRADEGRLDIRRRPGWRVRVRVDAETSYVLWEFHHAVCDGHGAMRFIEDVLVAYDAIVRCVESGPAFRPVEVERLKHRGDFSSFAEQLAPPVRPWWHPIRDAVRFHAFGPHPLRAPSDEPTARGGYPGVNSRVFDDGESARIRSRASSNAGTLNDAALTAVLRTLHDWNGRRCGGESPDRLRVLMPINLRVPADEKMPAANRMAFGFVTRDAKAMRDPAALAAGIRDETQYVRRYGLGLDFLGGLATADRWSLLPWILRKPRCMATAILTNMGDPTRRFAHRFPRREGRCVVGDLVLDDITGSPPLRPLTRAGFGIGTYAGRIVINAKCDPTLFADDDAREILRIFGERLLEGTGD